MDDLPSDVILNIFTRLPESADLANCRLTSRRLLSLSYFISSITLRPNKCHNPIPFNTRVKNLVSLLATSLQSISITAKLDDHSISEEKYQKDNEVTELYDVTDVDFLSTWLPLLGTQLQSLSLANGWSKSQAGFSSALAIISDTCKNLNKLVIRKAWLSFKTIKAMAKLTSLTLEYVKVDEEDFKKINESFPFLEVLIMNRVIGLREPTIHLPHLKICRFTGYPRVMAIRAPKLTQLKLRCIEPSRLALECPMVSDLRISIIKPTGTIGIETPQNLRHLKIKSLDVPQLLRHFKGTKHLRTLKLEVSPIMSWFDSYSIFTINDIHDNFGKVEELTFGPVAWYLWQRSLPSVSMRKPMCLRRLVVYLPPDNFGILGLMTNVLKMYTPLHVVHLHFFSDAAETKKDTIAKLQNAFPGVTWTWGISDKLSFSFFDRLPQSHFYSSCF